MVRALPLLSVAALAALLAAPASGQGWSWPDGQPRAAASASATPASKKAPASAASDTPAVTGRRYADSPGGRPRYEIVDPDSDDFTLTHPEDLAPGRPLPRPPPSSYPTFGAAGPAGYRPPRPLPPPTGNLGPLGPVGPVGANRPPPGVDHRDPTDVSKCKCVHAFNCEGNALSFGSCDVGKRYCCTKEPRGLGPRPGGGGYGATPGGPLGGPGGPGSGYYGKPAVLTGPGGPSGFGLGKDDRFDRLDRYPGPSAYDRYQGGPSGLAPGDRYPGDRYSGDRYPDDRYPGSRYPGSRYPGPGGPGVLVGPRPTPYRPDPAAGFAPGPTGLGSRPGGYYNNYSGVRGPSNSAYRDYDNYNRDRGYGLNRA